MSKKLAGTLFVCNGIKYDYCFMEAIQCLLDFCDHVFVCDAGSTDGTKDMLLSINSPKITLIFRNDWDDYVGQEKLNFFTNIAIKRAEKEGYEYQFNLQADEIVHERSYAEIRKAIETGCEAYMCRRINLWEDCYHQLVVPLNRMPCSTSIIRLAKTYCRSVGDAESLGTSLVDTYYENSIAIWHYGFVRKKEVMKSKIINMQCDVFGMEHYDQKLNDCEVFNPKLWFDGDDLAIVDSPHPKIMKEWIKDRP